MSPGSAGAQPIRTDDQPSMAASQDGSATTGEVAGLTGKRPGRESSLPGSQPGRRRPIYAVIAIVIAAILVVAGVMVFELLERAGSKQTTLLTKKGQIDLIPVNNSDAIVIHAGSPSSIEGNVAIIYVVVFYTMNTSQFQHLVKTMNASEYEYTSGPVQNRTNYPISIAVPAGWTYFVFANPSPVQTLVGFNTALELVPD